MVTTLIDPTSATPIADTEDGHPPPYDSLEAWVVGYFTPMFLHRISGNTRVRWCPQWWDHAEAIARLTLLWNGWEAARWEPVAKSGWWLDLDHHLAILLSLDGPFRTCRQTEGARIGKHHRPDAPEVVPAPPAWWD
jgi:hypothetical protein